MKRGLLLLVLVALVACEAEAPTTSPPTAPGPSTSQAPGVEPSAGAPSGPTASGPVPSGPLAISMEDAAATYLAIAKAHNRAMRKVPSLKVATLKQRKREWARIAVLEQRFADDLKAVEWPAEVKPDMDRLIRLIVVSERNARTVARAKDWDWLLESADRGNKVAAKTSDQAAIVRDILGLPSN